jgi:hypothetical protein
MQKVIKNTQNEPGLICDFLPWVDRANGDWAAEKEKNACEFPSETKYRIYCVLLTAHFDKPRAGFQVLP